MKNTRQLILSGILAAIICLVTMYLKVTAGTAGYFHLGDATILLACLLLNPWYAAGSAAIGSMFADIFVGYAIWSPATFIVKGLMALVVAYILKKNNKLPWIVTSGVIMGVIMTAGYFLYQLFFYHMLDNTAKNGFEFALTGVVGNLFQAASGVVIGTVLCVAGNRFKHLLVQSDKNL